jgi:hypothetical protein
LVLLVAAVFTASYHWGPQAWRQSQILYWQRQCMKYSPPADTVVYEEEPRSAAMLLTRTAEYWAYPLQRGNGSDSPPPTTNAAAADTRCLAQLSALLPPAMGLLGFNHGAAALAFLHERVSPAGHRRLVVVHYFPDRDTFTPDFIEGYDYITQAVTPATLFTAPIPRPANVFHRCSEFLASQPSPRPHVRRPTRSGRCIAFHYPLSDVGTGRGPPFYVPLKSQST